MAEWTRNRLPLRRVEAYPDVRDRILGSGHEAAEAPQSSPAPETAEPIVGEDGLTDFQRQWLALDEPEDTPQEEAVGSEPGWWEGVPAVRQLLIDGLDLGSVTVLLGENGSGKSTLVEGLAMAYGFAPEGGSTGSRHRTKESEAGLDAQLQFVRNGGAPRGGYFLRAETMHGFFSYLEDNPGNDPQEPLFHQLSHGESFVALVELRFRRPGFYVLDEPESALSFRNQLHLLHHLSELSARGTHQFVLATHSPILAAWPDADLYELDDAGFHAVDHDDAMLVRQWRSFLADPAAYL